MRFRIHQGQPEGDGDEVGFLHTNDGEDEIGPIRRLIVVTDHEVFEFAPSQLSLRAKTDYIGNRRRGFFGWFHAIVYGIRKYEW